MGSPAAAAAEHQTTWSFAQTGTEIISIIIKPFIDLLEKVLLGKPSITLEGSAAEVNDLHVKYKPSEAKVKVSHSSDFGDAPVVY
mmetsp:Transcript_19520/g.26379  ORF Transcript_19520/g.26379 Transcript_19520/m.26379 type:complete len:85 (-) Transcript_19520:139-393(-)